MSGYISVPIQDAEIARLRGALSESWAYIDTPRDIQDGMDDAAFEGMCSRICAALKGDT